MLQTLVYRGKSWFPHCDNTDGLLEHWQVWLLLKSTKVPVERARLWRCVQLSDGFEPVFQLISEKRSSVNVSHLLYFNIMEDMRLLGKGTEERITRFYELLYIGSNHNSHAMTMGNVVWKACQCSMLDSADVCDSVPKSSQCFSSWSCLSHRKSGLP